MMTHFSMLALALLIFSALARGQGSSTPAQGTPGMPCKPGMRMPGCPETPAQQPGQQSAQHEVHPGMQMSRTGLITMQPATFLQKIASHTGSGTSAEPTSTPAPMLMKARGPWMFMFHANAFVLDQQQSSPRGGDKFFSVNWLMPMAQRELGRGVFTVRAMLSFEPATVTKRRYPLLFQEGETAFGKPITDGQHPHDFLGLRRGCE